MGLAGMLAKGIGMSVKHGLSYNWMDTKIEGRIPAFHSQTYKNLIFGQIIYNNRPDILGAISTLSAHLYKWLPLMIHSYTTIYRSCPYMRHDLYLPLIPASFQTLGRVECAVASAPAPPGLRTISPPTLTLVFSEPSGRLQKFGPEFFLPSAHHRFGLCPCAPTLVLSSSLSSRCLHLGMSFPSLSFSPRLKFACF